MRALLDRIDDTVLASARQSLELAALPVAVRLELDAPSTPPRVTLSRTGARSPRPYPRCGRLGAGSGRREGTWDERRAARWRSFWPGWPCCVAGCTVGPSDRPPVAVRGESMPVPPPPPAAPPPPQMLPEPSPRAPTIPFYDCTDDVLRGLPTPIPAGRALRVDCGEIAVAGGPRAARPRPGVAGRGDRGRARGARGTDRRWWWWATPRASRRRWPRCSWPCRCSPRLLQRYVLVGMDRRGAGADLLDCAPLDARSAHHRRRSGRHR